MPILSRNSPYFKHFARILRSGLDLVFPPSCLVCKSLGEIEEEGMICSRCLGDLFQPARVLASHPIWVAGEYEGSLRELIHRSKFSADPLPLSILLLLLTKTVGTKVVQPFDLVTAIPGSPERIKERGIDLPTLLARRLAKKIDVPFSNQILKRARDSRPQTSLKRDERLTNLEGVFSIAGDIPKGHLLIVDDVVTTGATATAAFEAFSKEASPDLTFLALARTPEGIEGKR